MFCSDNETFTCQCQLGFYGEMCEELNPCQLGPCQNSATCSNESNGEFTCQCPPGYQGKSHPRF